MNKTKYIFIKYTIESPNLNLNKHFIMYPITVQRSELNDRLVIKEDGFAAVIEQFNVSRDELSTKILGILEAKEGVFVLENGKDILFKCHQYGKELVEIFLWEQMEATKRDVSILLVDDEPTNLNVLHETLKKTGYSNISIAKNGSRCKRLAQKHDFDLILLDIMMPEEDGFSVIQWLKNNPKTDRIPVIFITALSDIQSKITGFEYGAVDFITKPFNSKEVLARVSTHLKIKRTTEDIELRLNRVIKDITQRTQEVLNKVKSIGKAQLDILISPEDMPEAQFGIYYQSLNEAGGDFYDVVEISPAVFGYFMGDVSGHDLKESFITPSVKTAIQLVCKDPYRTPVESMKMINSALLGSIPNGKYLTATYILLNKSTWDVEIICMAHPAVIYVPKEGSAEFIPLDGDVLGIFQEAAFGSKKMKVKKGDRFYIYTDGLIEKDNKPSENKELMQHIVNHLEIRNTPLLDAPQQIIIKMFGDVALEDDITMMVIEV